MHDLLVATTVINALWAVLVTIATLMVGNSEENTVPSRAVMFVYGVSVVVAVFSAVVLSKAKNKLPEHPQQ